MRKKISIIIVVISMLQISCQKDSTILTQESIAIVNLLYNKESNKFPVPPPPNQGLDNILSEQRQKNTDAFINKKTYAIAINNKVDLNKEAIELPAVYKEILLSPSKVYTSKSLSHLVFKDINNNIIPFVSYTKDTKVQMLSKEKQVIGLLFFSDIKFNRNLTKAIITFGSYTHELAGYTSIIGLNKKNGAWEISFSKNVSES